MKSSCTDSRSKPDAHVTVDARHLPAPEPMEHVLEALSTLPPQQTLRFLIHREPFPLYELLKTRGYEHLSFPIGDDFEVFIWQTS